MIHLLLSFGCIFLGLFAVGFNERKSAVCSHFRNILGYQFIDLSEQPNNHANLKLVFASGELVYKAPPLDPILGIKAADNSLVLERCVEML